MSLRIRLLIAYACFGIFVLAIVGGTLFVQVKNDRTEDIERDMMNQLIHLDFALTNLIDEAKSDISQLSENELVRTTDDDDFTSFLNANESTFEYNIGETEQGIIDILNGYRTTHQYVNSVYMGRENGTFVRSHPRAAPTQYDPRERPWYTAGKENPGQVVITEPYESLTTTDVNIGVVTALVGEDGQVYGVVGADITLNNLTDYMSGFEVGYQGQMLLTDDDGTILAFADTEFLFKNITALLGDTAAADVMSDDQGYIYFENESSSYFIYLNTSPELGWKLAIIVPAQVIKEEIQGTIFSALLGLFLALAALIALALLGLNISIIKPLRKLNKVALDITNSGDLNQKTGISSKNEVGTLAASFDRMTDTLREKGEALITSETRYRRLFEEAQDGILIIDAETGAVVSVNPFLAELLGYPREQLIGKPVWELGTFKDVIPDREGLSGLQRQGYIRYDDLSLRTGDGRQINVEFTGNVYPVGNSSLIQVNIRNITERKRAEAALRESEAKYRFLTEKMNDVVWILDMNLKTTYVSPSVTKMLGYTPEERMKQSVTEQLTPESLNNITQALAVELEREGKDGIDPDRQLTVEMECYHKNGSTIWMEAVVSAIRDEKGKIIGIHGVSRDVTERRKTRETLREAKEYAENLIKTANVMIVALDAEGKVTLLNETGEKMTGYKASEAVGKSWFELIVPRKRYPCVWDEFNKLKDSGATVDTFENPILTKSGEERIISWKNSTLTLGGKFVGTVSFGMDITERKQAEKALLLYKEHLEELVKERTTELDKAKIIAEAANKAKSDFLANMSHEIRTPLSTIIGFSELLYDETKGPLNNDQKKYMGYVTSAGEHLLSLINDVLDLSKVESGKMELLTTNFSISDLLRNSLSFIAEKSLKHNIKLLSAISADVGMIEADERKVKQILYNLLSNAAKFTPDGGTITLSAEIVSPDSPALPADMRKGLTGTKYVLISVKDTGIGIAKKDQAKLFTEFYQIEEPYAKKYEGTGLGLALSKRLVTLHGGRIWLESKGKEKGSTFYFILPLKTSPKS